MSDFVPDASSLPAPPRDRLWLHIGLFVVTFVTMTVAGVEFYASFISDIGRRPIQGSLWSLLPGGLWFSVPALLILFCHEMGHYLACRYYGIRSSLPYFIPAPPIIPIAGGWAQVSFGTLGAVIRIRQPILLRRALFDIGIGGPIGGVLIAFPVLVFALLASRIVPHTPTAHTTTFGDPLALQFVAWLVFGDVREGYALNLHPAGFAAWLGMLMTALNLIPAGQLDGGHIASACLGRHGRWLTVASCGSALAAGLLLSPTWLVWLGFISVILSLSGWRHARVLDEEASLGAARWGLAVLAIVILILCFIPIPLQ